MRVYTVGNELEIEIKKIGINGEGIGYIDKMAVFVDEALPNEVVKVILKEVYPNRLVAELKSVVTASPDRCEIQYPAYQLCGAFEMQHVRYQAQLKMKRDMLINALNRYVKEKIVYKTIKPTIPMNQPLGYRNKVSLPVRKIKGKNVFGLYQKNSNEFIPVNDTPIQDESINEIIQSIEKLMDQYHFDAYIQKEKSGYMKSAVIRRTTYLKEVQVSFLLMTPFENIKEFVEELVRIHDDIKSVYVYYTKEYKEQIFFTDQYELVYGTETIEERLGGFKFSLYPEAFFQLNSKMADTFYKQMKRMAQLKKTDVVIDAYAGIAPVSHYLAADAGKIYAIEKDIKSAQSAKLSLSNNKIENVVVLQNDFFKAIQAFEEHSVDVIVFDPPRSGLGSDIVKALLKLKPKRIVYGSCNPSTLAKDINELLVAYKIKEMMPLDMFPYTPLVESVSLLELKEPNKAIKNH